MDNPHQFSYMSGPPPSFTDPVGLDGAGYAGGGAGPPPMPPHPPPPAGGHAWGVYQHHPPVIQHHWPPFPPFDPSRPPPGTFENPSPSWTHNQWSHLNPEFPHSAPPPYQSNNRPDNSAHFYSPNQQNYTFTNRSWLDEPQNKSPSVAASDEESKQRLRDEQWVQRFLLTRKNKCEKPKQTTSKPSISEFKDKLYGTVEMLSELNVVCRRLKDNLENEDVWTDTLSRATELKNDIQRRLADLKEPRCISNIQRKLMLVSKKRARMRRRKMEQEEEKQEQEARRAEREAEIDKWQMKRILEVEEKNREKELKLAADAVLSEVRKKQADAKRMLDILKSLEKLRKLREKELKLAADAVLSEVRKKQADAKRMLDILKSLEKLRKLRKEAAARKAMFPGKESDDRFDGHLERLRSLIQKRTTVYSTEETALRVMLEGEQEEERKRDRDKRLKKERDKLLQKKKELHSMLFGAELPPDHPLQPFLNYYTQTERSLPALIQIRREWDQFLVSVDHPDGTSIPHGWILPEPPADDIWATALEK